MVAAWSSEIGCEGGPVLVANGDDFRQWYGAEPFPPEARRELHLWSAFTSELPVEFRPQGLTGHQYIPSDDPARLRDQLIDVVSSRWSRARVDRTNETWIVTLPDGRTLHASLYPESEYDRAIRDLQHEAVYTFSSGGTGYLWSAEPGLVLVSVSPQFDRLHLAQVGFADDDSAVAEAYRHAREADGQASGLSYEVTAGPVVAAWAPNSFRDLSPSVPLSLSARTDTPRILDLATGSSGVSLWLEPGRYDAHTGYHESETWGVNWCTLRQHG